MGVLDDWLAAKCETKTVLSKQAYVNQQSQMLNTPSEYFLKYNSPIQTNINRIFKLTRPTRKYIQYLMYSTFNWFSLSGKHEDFILNSARRSNIAI